MKKLLLITLLIVGCATIKKKLVMDKSTAYFKIGMTEEEFIRKNPSISEKTNESSGFFTYIESEKKYKYTAGIAIPLAYEEYMFEFKNDTLIAVYRGRNNFSSEIDYSKYPNSKP